MASARAAVTTGSYALQSGGESMASGIGKGMKQALLGAKNRIEKSKPLVCFWSPVSALKVLLHEQPMFAWDQAC